MSVSLLEKGTRAQITLGTIGAHIHSFTPRDNLVYPSYLLARFCDVGEKLRRKDLQTWGKYAKYCTDTNPSSGPKV